MAFRIADPRWHLVRWNVEGRPSGEAIRTEVGTTTPVILWARRAFQLRGTIVDERRAPVARARIQYGVPIPGTGASLNIGMGSIQADEQGRFEAGPFAEDAGAGYEEAQGKTLVETSMITVSDDAFATVRIDPRSIPFHDREDVTIVLPSGVALSGVLVDAAGKPLADAVVAAEYGLGEYALRRAVRTNARGEWKLKHLAPKGLTLVAHAFEDGAKARREIASPVDDAGVRLVADPIKLSREPRTTTVLGMALVDVDDEIRAAYDVPDEVHVMILDVGAFPGGLGIGHLERGYGILMVGMKPVASVREAVERLVAEPSNEDRQQSPPGMRRVVYSFWDENGTGNNTQHLELDETRSASLRATLESLKR